MGGLNRDGRPNLSQKSGRVGIGCPESRDQKVLDFSCFASEKAVPTRPDFWDKSGGIIPTRHPTWPDFGRDTTPLDISRP